MGLVSYWQHVLTCLLFFSISQDGVAESSYIGSKSCAACHQSEYQQWRKSHHYHAMAKASSDTVLGDFDDAVFEYDGQETRFFKKNDKFFVRTEDKNGDIDDFEIDFTFGIYPLQQYLIEFPDGRLQALSVAWDGRPAKEGGQRWYHLYPRERVDQNDVLHWTGVFQNWNGGCAACHVTGLEKNYSQAYDRYNTAWSEINVACEGCHGKGSEHVRLVSDGADLTGPDTGFGVSLADHGMWRKNESGKTARRTSEDRAEKQIETCAACHSRREQFGRGDPGSSYLNNYSPALLEDSLYFPDGQVRDEVYVYGSFLQSKMYVEGVSCTNCHNPHNLKLKLEGNKLCLQCHQATVFDTPAHHFHDAPGSGAQCIACHMPETTYMGIDNRRDHSFRIPDPAASMSTGSPDACLQCHEDRDHTWSAQNIEKWYGTEGPRYMHTEVLHRARNSDVSILPGLLELARDETSPSIIRATALLESRRFPSHDTLESAITALASEDSLLRLGAVRSLEYLPAPHRFQVLRRLVQDPVKAVRIEVARTLAGAPLERLKAEDRTQLNALFEEFLEARKFNADRPDTQVDLGLFYLARGRTQRSEEAFRHALKLSPGYVPAMLNLADLYREQKREEEAEKLLRQAVSAAPDMAAAHHALGLLLVRIGDKQQALTHLEKAATLEPTDPQYAYVYSIALHDAGDRAGAIRVLEEAMTRHPANPQLRETLDYFLNQK